jgi:hypothetical protein
MLGHVGSAEPAPDPACTIVGGAPHAYIPLLIALAVAIGQRVVRRFGSCRGHSANSYPTRCGAGSGVGGVLALVIVGLELQLRSQPSSIPVRSPRPLLSLLVLVNGHVAGSTRAFVPPVTRGLVAMWSQFGAVVARHGVW